MKYTSPFVLCLAANLLSAPASAHRLLDYDGMYDALFETAWRADEGTRDDRLTVLRHTTALLRRYADDEQTPYETEEMFETVAHGLVGALEREQKQPSEIERLVALFHALRPHIFAAISPNDSTLAAPTIVRILPDEAQTLMDRGFAYIDVRTEAEFAVSHPRNAINIPLHTAYNRNQNIKVEDDQFMNNFTGRFPVGSKIILGCRSGVRSLDVARRLVKLGYTGLYEQRAGMEGNEQKERGWLDSKLGIETTPIHHVSD